MTTTDGGNGSGDGNDNKKPVGYKSPPVNGRIKKGEVRNPYGRNGRSGRKGEDGDPFAKVASRPARVIIDGQVTACRSSILTGPSLRRTWSFVAGRRGAALTRPMR